MDRFFSTVYKFLDRYSYPLLLTCFILWMCIGIFPLRCYETDGQEITLACDVLYREGWSFPPVYAYEYRMQPLTLIVVTALKHLLPFFTCEQIYGFLTVVFSLVFLLGCISFACHVTKAAKVKALLAAMLLPEMYAIAMYSNTAIPAAACFIWAMVIITKKRYWLAGLLMSIAVLFRLDVVIVFPTLLPLFLFEGKSWKQALLSSAAIGAMVVAAGLFGFWLVGAEALGTFGAFQKWNGIITPSERLLAILGFYSLAYVLLLPLGIGRMVAKRWWKELFLVALPILTSHVVFASFGNASKHFLYNAPFVIIAGIRAMEWMRQLLRNRPLLKWATVVGVVLFMTVSVRKGNPNMPWIYNNPLTKTGVVLPLYETEHGGTDYLVGLGAGFQLITGDEYMLLTGHLFYPWYIHTVKQITGDWRRQQKAVIDTLPTSNILTFEYGASAPISYEYLSEGYHFRQMEKMPESYRFTLSGPQRQLHFFRVVLWSPISSKQQALSLIKKICPDFLEGDHYILSAPNHYGACYFMDELVADGCLEKKAERLYQIKK